MKNKKPFIYDKPIIKTQRFEVYLEGKPTIIVERKEIIRQAHNTACDVADIMVEHNIYIEVAQDDRVYVIKLVEDFIDKPKTKKIK